MLKESQSENSGRARKGAERLNGSTGAYKEKVMETRLTIRLSDEEKEILEKCSEILEWSRKKS